MKRILMVCILFLTAACSESSSVTNARRQTWLESHITYHKVDGLCYAATSVYGGLSITNIPCDQMPLTSRDIPTIR